MSCKPDFSMLVSEIECLIKNHSRSILESQDRPEASAKSVSVCENECCTVKITLDIFVKLHQMLHNYIGLLNFRGPKSRDFDCVKIPLHEALDVAVRTMMSSMQLSDPKQSSSTPICLNCAKTSECGRGHFVNPGNQCDSNKLSEIEEVDKMLHRLKTMTLENGEKVEANIKEILHGITKLPLAAMTNRLETLSSVVRNTKNKLTSCGRSNEGSLMRMQVNPISQIISEFILEYGQIKSKMYPCRKICRFCNSIICSMDRRRNIFCCENARHLNFLWKEWTRQNSLKGVAEWDEDTILSIVDSFKKIPIEGNHCTSDGPCCKFYTIARQRGSEFGGQDIEGDNKKHQRIYSHNRSEQKSRISSDLSQNESQNVENYPRSLGFRGVREKEGPNKIGRSGTWKKQDNKDPGKEDGIGASRNQDKGKGRGTDLHNSKRSTGIRDIATSDLDKANPKKGLKIGEAAGDFNGQDDDLQYYDRKKSSRIGREDLTKMKSDLKPEKKRQGKLNKKKEGEFFGHSSDQGIDNTGQISRVESLKKERGSQNDHKDRKNDQETNDSTSTEQERSAVNNLITSGNSVLKPQKLKNGLFGSNNDVTSPGMKKRKNYSRDEGKLNSVKGRVAKSGIETLGDSKNIIRYQLSNELFIKLGWTILPKDTIMRRVVEFQALVAKPHMNWFKNNRIHGKQYYSDDKTIFTNFLDDGSGHIYYPNGQIAIIAQTSKKGTHELYKVYTHGGRDIMGVVRSPSLMGVFDSMGNGVIYDEDCNIRLTYNQHGGVYVDNPAKVPFSWGWNNFQTFPIDEAVYQDPTVAQLPPELMPAPEERNSSSKISKRSKSSKETSLGKLSEDRDSMESQKTKAAELLTVIPRKMITPLKPICLKMNEYLSLRILDRKNINLKFFAAPKCVRIELGTEIDPNVQVNSELVDYDEWTTEMTKNRLHMDLDKIDLSSLSPENSMLEIAKEFQHAKNEANSRNSMIAKYRPHLKTSSSNPSRI